MSLVRERSQKGEGASAAAAVAVREAARFDRGALSLTEPATRRIDAHQSNGLLTSLRRLIQAAHVARLEVQAQADPIRCPRWDRWRRRSTRRSTRSAPTRPPSCLG